MVRTVRFQGRNYDARTPLQRAAAKRFPCPVCGKAFESEVGVVAHAQKVAAFGLHWRWLKDRKAGAGG